VTGSAAGSDVRRQYQLAVADDSLRGWSKNSATAQGTAQPCYGPTGATGPARPGPPAPPRSVAATWGVDGGTTQFQSSLQR